MLQGKNSSVHHPENIEDVTIKESALGIAVSPLAMPILAGPGTIATAMNFSAQGGYIRTLVTVGMFALLCTITYACFLSGKKIVKLLGTSFLGVVTRMMGLILAVIGVQMLILGVHGAIRLV